MDINRKMLAVLGVQSSRRLQGREDCSAELEEALAFIRESIARENWLQAEEQKRLKQIEDDARR